MHDNVIGCMCTACWIPQAIDTHTQIMYYLLLFHCSIGCTNARQCFVIRTVPLLLKIKMKGDRHALVTKPDGKTAWET